jgi:YVTN family beta-propeller protein
MKRLTSAALAVGLMASGFASSSAAAEYKVLDHIKLADGGFDYASFDAVRSRVYMARPDLTTVIDTRTGEMSQLTSASGGHMLLAIPGGSLGLLPQRRGTIRLIDIDSDKLLADLPAGTDPDAAAFDPLTKLVFVVNKGSGEVSVVDPTAKKIVAVVPIGGTLQFPVSDGKGHVFVNVDSVPEVAVVDVKSMTVSARYKLNGCQGASGLAYAAETALLISGCTDGWAKVFDASTGVELASLAIGKGADAAFYDPQRKVALLPCGEDGVLEVISLADRKHISVVQHVATQAGARTGAVDPRTGRIYMMTSKRDPTKRSAAGFPLPIAGTFELIVVGPE